MRPADLEGFKAPETHANKEKQFQEQDMQRSNIGSEAWLIFQETGLTPRQLAEQRAELLEALENAVLVAWGPGEVDSPSYRLAMAAINKAWGKS